MIIETIMIDNFNIEMMMIFTFKLEEISKDIILASNIITIKGNSFDLVTTVHHFRISHIMVIQEEINLKVTTALECNLDTIEKITQIRDKIMILHMILIIKTDHKLEIVVLDFIKTRWWAIIESMTWEILVLNTRISCIIIDREVGVHSNSIKIDKETTVETRQIRTILSQEIAPQSKWIKLKSKKIVKTKAILAMKYMYIM